MMKRKASCRRRRSCCVILVCRPARRRRRRPCPPKPCPPPTPFFLSLEKTDATTGERIGGAVFQLRDLLGQVVQEETTNSTGEAIFTLYPNVRYTLIESAPAIGYQPQTTVYDIIVDHFGRILVNGQYTGVLQISNQRVPAFGFSFFKSRGDGMALPGAGFSLSQNGVPIDTVFSDIDGIVSFSGLNAGSYFMVESFTPAGYVPSGQAYNVVIQPNGSVSINGFPIASFTVANLPDLPPNPNAA